MANDEIVLGDEELRGDEEIAESSESNKRAREDEILCDNVGEGTRMAKREPLRFCLGLQGEEAWKDETRVWAPLLSPSGSVYEDREDLSRSRLIDLVNPGKEKTSAPPSQIGQERGGEGEVSSYLALSRTIPRSR